MCCEDSRWADGAKDTHMATVHKGVEKVIRSLVHSAEKRLPEN